jgi:hypothetical protein
MSLFFISQIQYCKLLYIHSNAFVLPVKFRSFDISLPLVCKRSMYCLDYIIWFCVHLGDGRRTSRGRHQFSRGHSGREEKPDPEERQEEQKK